MVSHSAVLLKESGQPESGFELGTHNSSGRPLATRPPPTNADDVTNDDNCNA